jgi:antitoxin component of MazEF toxin-antitoxin module
MIIRPIRSLIEQGSSLTLTLPREWTAARGLSKGDYVRIEEEGNALKVTPYKEE